MQAIAREDQRELFRDAHRAFNVQRGTGNGDVADGAVYDAATELNCSGLEHSVPIRSPLFDHDLTLRSSRWEYNTLLDQRRRDFVSILEKRLRGHLPHLFQLGTGLSLGWW